MLIQDWIRGCDMIPSDQDESNLDALLSSESVFEFEFVDDDVPMSVTSGGESTTSNSELKVPSATAGFSVLRDATHKGMEQENGEDVVQEKKVTTQTQMKGNAQGHYVSTLLHHDPTAYDQPTMSALSQPTQTKRSHAVLFAFPAAAQWDNSRAEVPRRISAQTVDLPRSTSTGTTNHVTTMAPPKPHASTEMCTRPPRDDEEDFLQMIDSTLGPF